MCGILLAPLSPFHIHFYLLCDVLSFNVIVKRCEAAHAWVVSGAKEFSIYHHYHYFYYLMIRIKLARMLYFFVTAHKAACRTLSKAFLKHMKTW